MAELRNPTQEEINRLLFMSGIRPKTTGEILQSNLAPQTIAPLPRNVFQKIAGGAAAAEEAVNKVGTFADFAKLFPGYMGTSKINIPTGYSFAPKQSPTGEIIPSGLQTQEATVNQILQAIKPADVLGISGAQRAYSDIGLGKAPQPLDVLDVAGLGATGLIGGKAALQATKGLPVGMSIQEAKGLLQTAPKSDIGFYSAVEQAAMASPRKSGAGQAFLNDIMKGQDVRADEIKWMGLDEFLKGKQNVTKQEVQDYIANNRVNVQEVMLGENLPSGFSVKQDQYGITNVIDPEGRIAGSGLNRNEAIKQAGFGVSKFGQYTLPGGENYRELLLTMPNTKATRLDARRAEIEAKGFNATEAEKNEWASIMNQLQPETRDIEGVSKFRGFPDYKSPHFDQRNILAHLRVNDRVDADGKKMLLIEEVQSDWHQAGREKGYKNIEQQKAFEAALEEAKQYSNELKEKYGGANVVSTMATVEEQNKYSDLFAKAQKLKPKSEIPDAPFKDTWYQLALKRAIQHAAENGYDRIGLTTGSQQAARFDLSKQLNSVSYRDGVLKGYDKNNELVINQSVQPKDLSNYVGKDLASKMAENSAKTTEIEKKLSAAIYNKAPQSEIVALRSELSKFEPYYSGLDLQVGGEGMKKYYDEIYPKFLDKYGKKWGARVGETKVNTVMEANPGSMIPQMGQEPVRYIDITPEMKAGVSKGQPLFQAAPIIGTGLLGQQEER